MADNKPFGPARCERLATASLDLAETILLESGKQGGGALTVGQIEKVFEAFRTAPDEIRLLYNGTFHSCWEAAQTLARRQDLFGRLIVSQFSHLFADPNEPNKIGEGILSRNILPSFLTSLQVICGSGFANRARERCARIINSMRDEGSPDIDWEAFFVHPESVRVLHMTLVLIAMHFGRDYAAKRDTFIEMMNYRPSDAAMEMLGGMVSEAESTIHFDHETFVRLMLELFYSVRTENLPPGRELNLAANVSDRGVAALRDFIHNVKKDAGMYFASAKWTGLPGQV